VLDIGDQITGRTSTFGPDDIVEKVIRRNVHFSSTKVCFHCVHSIVFMRDYYEVYLKGLGEIELCLNCFNKLDMGPFNADKEIAQ